MSFAQGMVRSAGSVISHKKNELESVIDVKKNQLAGKMGMIYERTEELNRDFIAQGKKSIQDNIRLTVIIITLSLLTVLAVFISPVVKL